jgi:hypothetical protein
MLCHKDPKLVLALEVAARLLLLLLPVPLQLLLLLPLVLKTLLLLSQLLLLLVLVLAMLLLTPQLLLLLHLLLALAELLLMPLLGPGPLLVPAMLLLLPLLLLLLPLLVAHVLVVLASLHVALLLSVHFLDGCHAERQCASASASWCECLLLLLPVLSCPVLQDTAAAGAGAEAVCYVALLHCLAHVPTAAEGPAGVPVMRSKPFKVLVTYQ